MGYISKKVAAYGQFVLVFPCDRSVDLMVLRIGPKGSTTNSNGAIGLIRYNI